MTRPDQNPENEPIETGETIEARPYSAQVGINEAGRLTGRSKGQIGNDTKSGRLSYTLNERGNKQYQVSELDRVYGLQRPDQNHRKRPEDETGETTPPIAELAALKAQLALKDEIIKDLRDDKERLWQQLQHQLPAPQPATAAPTASTMPAEPQPAATAARPTGLMAFFQRISAK